MAHKDGILSALTSGLDLPGEALGRVPVAELWGSSRVLVENHMGVLSYSAQEILVRVSYGCLKIQGKGLTLTAMTGTQLILSGKIQSLSLLKEEPC